MGSMIDFLSAYIELVAVGISRALVFVFPFLPDDLPQNPGTIMVVIGFGGQFLFAMRFLIQWVTSEGAGRSVIPLAFWYFSIGGGTVLLIYALWRKDPVIIAGQGLGLFIYFRNLYLIHRERENKL